MKGIGRVGGALALLGACMVVGCSGASVVGGPDAAGDDLGFLDVVDAGGMDALLDTGNDAGVVDTGNGEAAVDVPIDRGPGRCSNAAECVGDPRGSACDTVSGNCVSCTLSDDRCPSGQYCAAPNVCVAGCRDDMACMSGDAGVGAGRCNPQTRQCVACVTDAHCAPGTLCVGNLCVAGCNPMQPCASGQSCCDGACLDLQSNVASCGTCGTRCTVANAAPLCTNGACAVGACTAPFANCDGMAANGCETSTLTSLAHCGACNNACPSRANATATCEAGTCRSACNTGFGDCDGDATNGCETNLLTDATHCGTCPNRCALANATAACVAGQCAVATCATGFANCDTNVANGCETDTRTSVSHCGACGTACMSATNAVPVCASSACAITCTAGFADCDGVTANGCETNLSNDVSRCGACNNRCTVTGGTAACNAGQCALAACNTGLGDCDGSATNGCETTLATSNNHCGACNNRCGAGTHCESSMCVRDVVETGCALNDGGVPGTNVLRRFCRISGGVMMVSGALGGRMGTLTISRANVPTGARVVRAMLYRQTYDQTATYWSAWSVAGTSLASRTRRVGLTNGSSPYEVVRADITAEVQTAFAASSGTSVTLPITHTPTDSSGGFGFWVVYTAPTLPERTVVVYDGGLTDTQPGNGAFSLDGFVVGARPVTATLHLHGGGDDASDAPSTARFATARSTVALNDVTEPLGGNYAGTQVANVAAALDTGDVYAAMDFTLRNYSGVAFAALDVNAPAPERCTPDCGADQLCVGGACVSSLGCATGPRRGFTSPTQFPNMTACGSPMAYAEMALTAATVCAPGWRHCTAADVRAAPLTPVPDLTGLAWVNYVDAQTTRYGNYLVPACGGTSPAVANLAGTGGCTPSGTHPEGWRLALSTASWGLSHQSTAGCIEHTFHQCAYPGGSVTAERAYTLCCR